MTGISPIGTPTAINYCGTKKTKVAETETNKQTPTPEKVVVIKQTGGAGAGLGSAIFPGLGHLLDGRPLAGLGWCAGVFGSLGATLVLPGLIKNPKGSVAALVAGAVTTLGMYIANIVNAAKGKPKEVTLDKTV